MNKKRIRILHIAQAAGGVSRYLQSLLKYMDSETFENILVCSQDFKKEDFLQIADKIIYVKMNRSIGMQDIKAAVKVRKILKKYKPDLVYAHSSKAGAIGRIAHLGIKSPCVYNPHGWAFNMQVSLKKQKIYRWMEKIMTPHCDKIICISPAEEKSALDKNICKKEKLHIICNGIDLEESGKCLACPMSREQLGIPEDAFVVGMTGRLSRQKAPDIFIKMAEKVEQAVPGTHFVFVGEGEMEEEIRAYAERHKFGDKIHVTGWVDNPLSYVELFDVAVLLSRWEGFGLAIPEYMLAQKPLVASKVDAIPYLVQDHENGILVPPEDSQKAFEAVMEYYDSPELGRQLASRGYQEVFEKYDVGRTAHEHEKLFRELLRI